MSQNEEAPRHAASVLIVDDEPDLRTLYELSLLREGHRVESAGSLAEAHALLEEHRYEAVITDMRLPDGLGLELLQRMNQQKRAERCVVMTAYGSAENAVEALKAGAFDYLTKPVDLKQFRAVVAAAIQDYRGGGSGKALALAQEGPASSLVLKGAQSAPVPAGVAALARLVGASAAMHGVKERIAKVARSMAPVLVRGESGTGKELVASAVHACSHRSRAPFVAVNCGAIPESLLEAEFFGARKGSYTGATQDRMGYFQAARGGTLFLDEIGDLPLAMQSKLLRAIQERSVRPLGSTQEDAVDVRIVSATHRDLAADVHAGRFRQDLYYRLNVIEIVVPPLRERREDLPALCAALLARIAQESGLSVPKLSEQLLQQLQAHELVGNVRELENLLHRAMALSNGEELQVDLAPTQVAAPTSLMPSALAPASSSEPPSTAAVKDMETGPGDHGWGEPPAPEDALPGDLQAYLDRIERAILVRALAETGFNRTATAAKLGLSQRQIRYRIARLNISMPQDGRNARGEDPVQAA